MARRALDFRDANSQVSHLLLVALSGELAGVVKQVLGERHQFVRAPMDGCCPIRWLGHIRLLSFIDSSFDCFRGRGFLCWFSHDASPKQRAATGPSAPNRGAAHRAGATRSLGGQADLIDASRVP